VAAGESAKKRTLPEIVDQAVRFATDGRVEEARELMLAALEALAEKNRELELLLEKLRRQAVGKRGERVDPRHFSFLFTHS
jgi:hypothetical protein